MTQNDYVAHNGTNYSKKKRTEEYNLAIADREKIVGDNSNGYRLKEPTKWMEDRGMVQIKERLKESLGQIKMDLIGNGIPSMAN